MLDSIESGWVFVKWYLFRFLAKARGGSYKNTWGTSNAVKSDNSKNFYKENYCFAELLISVYCSMQRLHDLGDESKTIPLWRQVNFMIFSTYVLLLVIWKEYTLDQRDPPLLMWLILLDELIVCYSHLLQRYYEESILYH